MYEFAVSCIACCLAVLAAAALSCCDDRPETTTAPEVEAVDIGRDFHAETSGEVRGRVTWQGAIPSVPTYRAPVSPGNERTGQPHHHWPNPNVPRIDSLSKAVSGVVVFLRGVDPRKARPWDHPAIRVELRDYQIQVCQSEREGNSGFVRRGQEIEMLSRQELYHVLRVRGAAFFSRAFPDANQLSRRLLDHRGIVELSSGCGYFWMRGWLFVDDHPYYTHTDDQGNFTLPQVPPGRYDLVCWLPDWHEASRDLDAETALICRLSFRPPVEIVQPVQIAPRQTQTLSIRFEENRFGP